MAANRATKRSTTTTKPAVRPLTAYDAKRDFTKSPEPRGAAKSTAKKSGLLFCVQKHLASHLHYDLRLEHRGVLLSWAVPKGPSLDPATKRMAVQVEDHPVDYGTFEGVIPAGYGAGIVLLWDRGTWTPEAQSADIDAAMAKGELKFRLDGVKLKGSWVLVRTRRKAASGPEQWLLIKHRDAWAGEVDVTTALPQSVKSFGDLPDILAAHDEPTDWKTSLPVKGGDTGKLFSNVLAQSRRVRIKQVAAPAKKPKSAPAKGLPPAALVMGDKKPKLTNLTKVLFPKTGFSKGDLIDYYTRVAPLILPHLAGRAITLKRYPDGVDGKSFFEKRCAAHRPGWLKTLNVARTDKNESIDYCAIADLPSLIWAANMAAIELHVPLALAAAPDTPTTMVFDLDPGPPAALADCVPIALRLKGLLDHLGLVSIVKTSGGKGLHILVPLNTPGVTFDDTKSFARAIALTLERDDPKHVISSMTRIARPGKVFIDWSQNDRNRTTVSVFSVRARETPTVSWPLSWNEVSHLSDSPVTAARVSADELGPLRDVLSPLHDVQRLQGCLR